MQLPRVKLWRRSTVHVLLGLEEEDQEVDAEENQEDEEGCDEANDWAEDGEQQDTDDE